MNCARPYRDVYKRQVQSHSETLTTENGAAVLRLSVHAVEQIGEEALDDSEIPPPETEEQTCLLYTSLAG